MKKATKQPHSPSQLIIALQTKRATNKPSERKHGVHQKNQAKGRSGEILERQEMILYDYDVSTHLVTVLFSTIFSMIVVEQTALEEKGATRLEGRYVS